MEQSFLSPHVERPASKKGLKATYALWPEQDRWKHARRCDTSACVREAIALRAKTNSVAL